MENTVWRRFGSFTIRRATGRTRRHLSSGHSWQALPELLTGAVENCFRTSGLHTKGGRSSETSISISSCRLVTSRGWKMRQGCIIRRQGNHTSYIWLTFTLRWAEPDTLRQNNLRESTKTCNPNTNFPWDERFSIVEGIDVPQHKLQGGMTTRTTTTTVEHIPGSTTTIIKTTRKEQWNSRNNIGQRSGHYHPRTTTTPRRSFRLRATHQRSRCLRCVSTLRSVVSGQLSPVQLG